MRSAEENPRHIVIADWNDQLMDMYLIRFRDTGYIPTCANSLTLNGRGGTRCESAKDLEDAGGPGRNERGCRYKIPGHQYTDIEYCTETSPELEVVQAEPVVDLVIENGAEVDASHPFHKHNHKVWIIGQGEHDFRWRNVEDALRGGGEKDFNLNPPYRDGFALQAGEGNFVVVRYEIYFPPVSMLPCHMIHHFASGQQVILLEGMEVMPPVPKALQDKPHVEFDMLLRYGPLD